MLTMTPTVRESEGVHKNDHCFIGAVRSVFLTKYSGDEVKRTDGQDM